MFCQRGATSDADVQQFLGWPNGGNVARTLTSDRLTQILRNMIVTLARRDGSDLTARQLAVLLVCGVEARAPTLRGLASKLHINKPGVSPSAHPLEGLKPGQRQ